MFVVLGLFCTIDRICICKFRSKNYCFFCFFFLRTFFFYEFGRICKILYTSKFFWSANSIRLKISKFEIIKSNECRGPSFFFFFSSNYSRSDCHFSARSSRPFEMQLRVSTSFYLIYRPLPCVHYSRFEGQGEKKRRREKSNCDKLGKFAALCRMHRCGINTM